MKRIHRLLAIFFFMIIFTGLLSASKLSAKEGSCYLKASQTDVYVILYDLNRNGDMGAKIWEGRINQGQEVLVTVPNARFRLYHNNQPDVNQPMSGGVNRWCNSKRTIGVP
jgi:hypothetical protein